MFYAQSTRTVYQGEQTNEEKNKTKNTRDSVAKRDFPDGWGRDVNWLVNISLSPEEDSRGVCFQD